jgi:hypothetical protein
MQVASAASSAHQQVTVVEQNLGAWLSDKRPSSVCPSYCAALPHGHSACPLRKRQQRAPPAWPVLAAPTRLCSMRARDLSVAPSHGQVHHWSRPCRLSFAPFSVARVPPSSPVALVPESSSWTRGWGEFVRHLPWGYRAWFRCPEAGWRAVSLLQKDHQMEASWACGGCRDQRQPLFSSGRELKASSLA